MAFKEVASLDADVIVALGKKDKSTGKPYPKQAEGYYLGMRTVESKRGESRLHFLQTSEGNLGVWGTTDLDRKLGQVAPGAMVRITSTGTKKTPNGDMYMYRVEEDSTNTITIAAAVAPEYESLTDDTEQTEEYSAQDADEDDAAQEAALAAASIRKAKVAALLNTKKAK